VREFVVTALPWESMRFYKCMTGMFSSVAIGIFERHEGPNGLFFSLWPVLTSY
jgi:hypothetical protein